MKSIELKTSLLLGFFVSAILLSNLLGNKITTLFGVRVSVAIFVFPFLFLITDIIEEVHGKKRAQSFVLIGLICLILTLIVTFVSIKVAPNTSWEFQEQYEIIFGASLRMMVASLIAFLISQTHDVWAFNFWKEKTGGKYLWLRNNASTIVSQFLDTTVFMFIAFYQFTPKFTVPFIFSLIIPYWLFKVLFAIIDTPFIYLGVWWLKKR